MDEVYFVAIAHEKRYANTKESDFAEYGYWSEPDMHGGNYRSLQAPKLPYDDNFKFNLNHWTYE